MFIICGLSLILDFTHLWLETGEGEGWCLDKANYRKLENLGILRSVACRVAYTVQYVFLNFQKAQDSIPGNRFRQPLKGGPVRQPYSFSVPTPYRLF
jgi:hypothetical protein